MRPRSAVLAFCAAFLAQVHAKIQFTNSDYHVVPGELFKLTWAGGDSSGVTIAISTGPDALHLNNVATVASGLSSSSYTLTLPTSIPPGKYAFTIAQDGATNYSPLFTVGSTAVASPTLSTIAISPMGVGMAGYPMGMGFTGLPTASYSSPSGGIPPPYIRYPTNPAMNGSGSPVATGSGAGMPMASQGFMGPAEAFLGGGSRLSRGLTGAMVAIVGLLIGAWMMV